MTNLPAGRQVFKCQNREKMPSCLVIWILTFAIF